ncbi:PP2C family protein-serine/threonine phosphatase [Anaerovorax odorimutans]|uniref:PP2C family protein-serine/threonine phosphatase n=1 Tax=Anaerovorax odorimutans TaxID=109327 RepID=A0ABT1RKM4_9FIRM|nr:PP2C family protein-serine/threonine phosphatase [Anaerovorax odorimutans]MCQ4635729.1 PP2C family protein-serine/threonine phosphatase [Anaerovorax odorimutans]
MGKQRQMLRQIVVFLLVGVIYFLLILPFDALNFNDGYSEIRLTGLVPMAAGLLFGVPGALGCAFGNLAGDIVTGLDILCTFGFVGNFLMAYLPYKLWHTLFFRKAHEPHFLDSALSVVKFMGISFLSACASVSVIAAGGQLFHAFTFAEFFVPVALQAYNFSIMGGMLIFQICTNVFRIKPCIPNAVYGRRYEAKRYIPDYLLTGAALLLAAILIALSVKSGKQGSPVIAVLAVALIACILLLAVLPMKRSAAAEKMASYRAVTGLRAQFITVFLTMLSAFLTFFTLVCLKLLYKDYTMAGAGAMDTLWYRIIISDAIAATVFIGILFLLLKGVQKRVVEPMDVVTEYAVRFAGGSRLKEDQLTLEKTGNELDQLGDSINVMTEDIRRYVEDIRQRTIAEEKLAAELEMAKKIQNSMLPGDWQGSGFDLVPFIKPAKEVSGDFYHFAQLDEDRVFICIADVSGKDISAAMFMVKAKTVVDTCRGFAPGKLFTILNNTLSENNDAMMFVTSFAGILDRKNHTFTYANAGHNPPLYWDRGRLAWIRDPADMVLGPMGGIQYEEHVMEVTDDFRLLVYTDGVTEAESQENGFFGEDRLFAAAEEALAQQGTDCSRLIDKIEGEIAVFTEGAVQSDDITMLTLAIER